MKAKASDRSLTQLMSLLTFLAFRYKLVQAFGRPKEEVWRIGGMSVGAA